MKTKFKNIKQTMVAIALMFASTANAQMILTDWEIKDNSAYTTSSVRQISCYGEEVIFSNKATGNVEVWKNGAKINEYNVNSFLEMNKIGEEHEDGTFTQYTLGLASAVDEMGNIIVNLNFPNINSSSKFVVIPVDGSDMFYLNCTLPNQNELDSANGGRMDYLGEKVAGDLTKDAYIYVCPQHSQYVSVVNIKNKEQNVSGSYNILCDYTFDAESSAIPIEPYNGKTAPAFLVRKRSTDGIRFSDGKSDLITMTIGNDGNENLDWELGTAQSGWTTFSVNNERYFVFNCKQNGARSSAWHIKKSSTGEIIATWSMPNNESLNTYVSSFASSINENGDVNIYQYNPGVRLSKHTLTFNKKRTFEVNGIYYKVTNIEENTVEVTFKDENFNSYSGDIVIPETVKDGVNTYKVTSIGNNAFKNCAELTSVIISNNVTTIKDSSFEGCTKLNSITIPQNVSYIYTNAFKNCLNLKYITSLAVTPPILGYSAFFGISTDAIFKVPFSSNYKYQNNENWGNFFYERYEENGIYYLTISENKVEVTYENKNYNSYSGDIVIPSTITVDNIIYNVESLGDSVFYNCKGLKSVILPESISYIGNNSFGACSTLNSITLPKGISVVKSNAFSGCSRLGGKLELPESLEEIQNGAFYNTNYSVCKINAMNPPMITSSSLPSNLITVIVPNGYADTYKSDSLWCNYTIIADGACDVEVTNETPGGLSKAILTQVKKNLSNITKLTVHGTLNEDDMEKINSNMISLIHLDISDTDVTEIPGSTFKDKTTFVSVILPNNLKTIGNCAFSGCKSICDNLVLPESIESIGDSAFYNCIGIGKELLIPGNTNSIGSKAFYNCNNLEIINIVNANIIGANAFTNCDNIETINITNTSTIGSGAFAYCNKLKSVNITGVSTIESYAFNSCDTLQIVSISNTSNLTKIDFNAFSYCRNLKNITLPESLTTIGNYAFYGCSKLAEIKFPSTLESLGDYAFSNCTNINVLDLSTCNELKIIPNSSFSNCTALETVNLPTSITSIESAAFSHCAMLQHMSVPCVVPPTIENNSDPFVGVDNIACILSIPTDKFFDYYDSMYWGRFIDVENKSDISIEVAAQNENDKENKMCHIHFKKHSNKNEKEMAAKRFQTYNTNNVLTTSDLAVTTNGSSLFIGNGEAVTFYITLEDNNEIDHVLYNNEDVTLQLINNTYTTPSVNSTSSFAVYLKNSDATSINNISIGTYDETIEYYNLNGVKVKNPEKGIYIKKQGGKTTKVVL